jgi:hypothetical protein
MERYGNEQTALICCVFPPFFKQLISPAKMSKILQIFHIFSPQKSILKMNELYNIISIFVTGGLLFIAAIFTAYIFCPAKTFKVVFYVFSAIYALLLVRYTFLFLGSYRQFQLRMDNYFSDMEAGLTPVAWRKANH